MWLYHQSNEECSFANHHTTTTWIIELNIFPATLISIMRLSNLFSKEIFLGLASRTRIAAPVSQTRTACRNKDLGVKRLWLGREDSNLRMAESKSAALPLGYAPTVRKWADHNRSGRFMLLLQTQFWQRSKLSLKKERIVFLQTYFRPFTRL